MGRTKLEEERRPVDDPLFRYQAKQLDFLYDRLYKFVPKPVDIRSVTVGQVEQGTILSMDIEEYCPTCITRITFKVNGVFKATARFSVNENGLWVANELKFFDKKRGKLVKQTDVNQWCSHPIFENEAQIGAQYLAFLKTGKKQKGIKGVQTIPLFMEAKSA